VELFYRHGAAMMTVPVKLGTELEPGAPIVLFRGRFQRGDVMSTPNNNTNYDVSADGKRFLMIQEPESTDAPEQIHLVINWFEELKRLVPSE